MLVPDIVANTRLNRRQKQRQTACQIGGEKVLFKVYELSAQGFSFLCPREVCKFQCWETLKKISILNAEGLEIVSGSGTVAHVSDHDYLAKQIGVFFTQKRLDRTISGKIRVPRHFPIIQLSVSIDFKLDSEQKTFEGIVLDYTASTVRVRLDKKLFLHVKIGDEVCVNIHSGETNFFDGEAYVMRIRDEGEELILHFISTFLEVTALDTTSDTIQNREAIVASLGSLSDFNNVSTAYKALISDWRMYLIRLKTALDNENKKSLFRTELEQEIFLKGLEDEIFTKLYGFIDRLNQIAVATPIKETLAYKHYFRENLTPIFKESPLIASVADKNHGYSGDFETVKQFFQDPYQGDSLFAKLINKFICCFDAVTAHQDRINFLFGELCNSYDKYKEHFSFLVLGSGPAEEVLRFISDQPFNVPIEAMLLDMDAYALADFSERLQYLPKENFTINLININIMNILRKREKDPVKSLYPLAYCAGMFDYFSDTICKRLVKYLISHTLPGGIVVVTNVHKNDYTQYFMDWGGGWEIIRRDEEEMRSLVPPGFKSELRLDPKKTNIFLKISVPLPK